MSEVDGVKAINKVTFGQRLKAYKRSKLSFLLAVLVLLSAIITIGVLGYLIFYILIKGVPNLSPDLFSLTYTSENVSMIPAIINTLIMTILALLIAVPLGIFSAIYMVEYAKKGNKLVGVVSVTTETLAGIILAIGRIVGETAALIFTAGTVPDIAKNLMSSGRTLAVHMYVLSGEGLHTDQAYATAVVLLVVVIIINGLSTLIAKKFTKA